LWLVNNYIPMEGAFGDSYDPTETFL
jgi:hypothetical protein